MIQWLLDDGPLGDLALQFDPAWSWPASTIHIVSEVAAGAQRDRSGRRGNLLKMSAGGSPAIEVHDIQVGSPAADMLFAHLRRDAADATEDLGEHASIAFCAMQGPGFVFVAADKQAAFLALAELGRGRVASPFDLWAHLSRAKLITAAQFEALCQRTVKTSAFPGVPRRFMAAP
jgi:hypothetical protein